MLGSDELHPTSTNSESSNHVASTRPAFIVLSLSAGLLLLGIIYLAFWSGRPGKNVEEWVHSPALRSLNGSTMGSR
jgi:hypothetical protein